jgi:hypothetical protein
MVCPEKCRAEDRVRTLSRVCVGIPLAFLLLPLAASAQNKTESVTVTGQTPQTRTEIMRGFVRSYVAPSMITGKLARWADPICPLVIGLQPEEKLAVSERIRKDAKSVGAPIQTRQPCKPNVTIAFAMDPQELMTKIVDRWSLARSVLGDIDGPMHARKVSKISSPIQAWYGTTTKDVRGFTGSEEVPYPDVAPYCGPSTPCYVVAASNLNNGIKSVFSNVFVVVDLSKVAGREFGTIADYVAMLTLSQTGAFATCRNMPSITNLLMQDCDANLKTAALSDADLAFLRGVYKANGGEKINLQIGDIVREMEKSPAGRNVKAPAQEQSSSTAFAPAVK